MGVNVTTKPKVRTIAKERYLKAKRDRRKARLAKKSGKKGVRRAGGGDGRTEEKEGNVRLGHGENELSKLEDGPEEEKGVVKPAEEAVDVPEEGGVEKKKKKRKERVAEDEDTGKEVAEAAEEPPKKRKKKKDDAPAPAEEPEEAESSKKWKKRKSDDAAPAEVAAVEAQEDAEDHKERKKKKADAVPPADEVDEGGEMSKKKKKKKADEGPVPDVVEQPPEGSIKRKKEKKKAKKAASPLPEYSDSEEQEDALVSAADPDLADDPLQPETDANAPMRSPTPPYLPSFPLPRAPAPPSASDLARLGLDRALLKADLVRSSLSIPLSSSDVDLGLSERTISRLQALGVENLFAVQAALWPWLLTSKEARRGLYEPYHPPRDACVSAPTGSGKTLAYAVPIVEILSKRIVPRLRALIVLPTRDLVLQVRETLEALCKGTGLRVGSATGAQSWAREQRVLVEDLENTLRGGSSKIDILVCTPGRLIDHLNETKNFSLQHLRFLVIDEADRLLTQSFQSFLPQVLTAITPPTPRLAPTLSTDNIGLPIADSIAPAWLDTPREWGEPAPQPSCQKLLFSATMTRDPGILKALGLRDPKYFVVTGAKEGEMEDAILREEFTVPDTLREHLLVVPSELKPLYLFHLLHTQPLRNVLIFTKSAESTTRLLRLLEFFESSRVASSQATEEPQQETIVAKAYSSDLAPGERRSILDQFKRGAISVLVASDLVSRGIDIPHVSHVVNYDIPLDMRKYVHRAGRTARAGREGDVWSLVEEQEARFFREMLKTASHWRRVKRMRMQESVLEPMRENYARALESLRDAYSGAPGQA